MTLGRACGLLVLFSVVAIALVYLRSERTRCSARVLSLESQWVQLRREWWSLQGRTARLRAPARVQERIETLDSGLLPPGSDEAGRTSARLAADRLYD